jgi:hypothetical protein
MFYLAATCTVCDNGVVGMYRCSDGKTIAYICTECGTVWDNPRIEDHKPVQFFSTPDPPLPGHNCSLGGQLSGWATLAEIAKAGLTEFIAGEGEV